MSELRAFYDVMVACGMQPPEWEAWQHAATENAELWPLYDHTQSPKRLFGGVLFKGQTVHIAIHPDYHGRWVTKALLRAYKTWTPACDVVATPLASNKAACEFCERLGWKRKGTTGQSIIYVKEAACHPH